MPKPEVKVPKKKVKVIPTKKKDVDDSKKSNKKVEPKIEKFKTHKPTKEEKAKGIIDIIEYKGKKYPLYVNGYMDYGDVQLHFDVFREILEGTKKKKKSSESENTKDKKTLEKVEDLERRIQQHQKAKGLSKNYWVNFVKIEAKKLGVSYPCAMTMPKVKRAYIIHKMKKGFI